MCNRNWRTMLTGWFAGLNFIFIMAAPSATAQFRDITPALRPATLVEDPLKVPAVDEVNSPADAESSDEASLPTDDETSAEPEPAAESDGAASPSEKSADTEPARQPDGDSSSEETRDEKSTTEVRPIRFNGVAAGIATEDELRQKWGEPKAVNDGDGQRRLKYEIAPFRQVNVSVVDGVVAAVLIFLDEPIDPVALAKELGLSDIVPVPVPDESGRVLGQGYPERGVLFSFTQAVENVQVARVQLEPISAELFVLRAEYDFQHQYQRDLNDLEVALKLAPDDARAHWLKAETLEQVGRYRSALESANEAVSRDSGSHRYRLTRARLQAHNGEHVLAVKETKQVLRSQELAPQLRALAECQLGDLIASGPTHQFKDALQHHLEAIKLAAPLANDHHFAPRRLAKEVLVNAHLAAAMDIARGNYKRKETVVAKWVQRAEALVEELVTHDQGDAALQLRLHRAALAASAELEGQLEVNETADEALKLGRRLIAVERDALRQSRIEWDLGTAMYEAMRVAAAQGRHTQALRHADNAMVLFEQSAPQRQSTPEQKYLVGKLYFVVGSMHAVHRNDHREAAVWYQKAEPLLSGTLPSSAQAESGLHGERLVSVAVSYWESGSREKAIELTEKGAEIMQAAVKDGQAPSISLAVPYGNLATMHEHLGNKEQAKTFSELAAKLEPGLIQR